ncbi:hypothetical protein WICMUC_004259 [Wickerhamomyces mucosus]|uniref:[PSI+] induction protein 2 n=1 Tax=Wickerhamomyces mucosus TaxID=1378264 RepID=A0A9P8TAG5_9ASCO|nr:hypothetical protein WICMUC_004259 [Wickerhamomyces mucosus]
MLIPETSSICPKEIYSQLIPRSLTSTAESFKHWNTCMDNKVCKIVAIVGIVLAAIVVISLIGVLLRLVCCGAKGFLELCCCCCSCCANVAESSNQNHHYNNNRMNDIPPQQKSAYDNPFMYPPKQEPMHYNNVGWNQGNYTPVQQPHYGPGIVSDEEKFDNHTSYNPNNYNLNNETHHGYRGYN